MVCCTITQTGKYKVSLHLDKTRVIFLSSFRTSSLIMKIYIFLFFSLTNKPHGQKTDPPEQRRTALEWSVEKFFLLLLLFFVRGDINQFTLAKPRPHPKIQLQTLKRYKPYKPKSYFLEKNVKKELRPSFKWRLKAFIPADQYVYICKQCRSRWDGALRPSHLDLLCLPFCYWFWLKPLCNNGCDRIRRLNAPFHKHRSKKANGCLKYL